MDVHIEELETNVRVADDASVLSPSLLAQVVDAVLAQLRDAERAHGLAERNTRLTRSAAGRPDRLR